MLATIQRSTSDGLAYEKHGDDLPVVRRVLHDMQLESTAVKASQGVVRCSLAVVCFRRGGQIDGFWPRWRCMVGVTFRAGDLDAGRINRLFARELVPATATFDATSEKHVYVSSFPAP